MKNLLIVQDWWDRIMQKKYFCFLFLVLPGGSRIVRLVILHRN